MEEINLDNLRTKFQKLIDDLNTLNKFCIENEVSFSIDPRPTIRFSPATYIYQWEGGFYLNKLKQTKELNL